MGIRVGGGYCGIFGLFIWSASLGWKGRAVVQPGKGEIFAGLYRFSPDEPENEANLARSATCS